MTLRLAATRDQIVVGSRQLDPRNVLLAAMLAVVAFVLLIGHDTTFSTDEIDWFASTPGLDLHGLFAPYNGHLIAGERLVYDGMFHAFGVTYFPFRVMGLLGVLATVGMLFAFARKRVGGTVALLPCLVLLVYGSDAIHLLQGNALGDLAPLAIGIAALFALERDDRAGDIAACLLLTAGVSVYSVGLAFVGGATVLTLADPNRRRRAWVVAVPILLYAVWLVATHGQSANTGQNVKPWNLLLAPVWSADSLGAVGSSLFGLNYPDFETDWKPVVAVALAVLIFLRLRRGVSPWLLATGAIPLTLWALAATAAQTGERIPGVPRYMFPGTVCLLIFAAEAARGMRLSRGWMIALAGVTAVGLATNLVLLGQGSNGLRDTARASGIELAALEEAQGRLGFQPPPAVVTNATDPGTLLWAVLGLTGHDNVATGYLQAVGEFGSPAYTDAQIQALPEADRVRADAAFVSTLGIQLKPTSERLRADDCRRFHSEGGQPISIPVNGAGLVLRSPAGGDVGVRRFGTIFPASVGALPSDGTQALSIPDADSAEPAWVAVVTTPQLTACQVPFE